MAIEPASMRWRGRWAGARWWALHQAQLMGLSDEEL